MNILPFTIFCLLALKIFALPLSDEIFTLPGWSPLPLPSRQFSGFVNASDDGYLQMHYWFVEAENEAGDYSPLILWFNGGPGASSLYGLLVELGPFLLNDISLEGPEYLATGIPQLIYNDYGWQKIGNILAMSMPPPVGFSYCNPPGSQATGDDCGAWNDTSTAEATYTALKSWMKKFPEFADRDMYIAGESYAGVYVPMLVKEILSHAEDEDGASLANQLRGFLVGDACTPPDICGDTVVGPYFQLEFLYGKSAFSNQLYERIYQECTTTELINGGTYSTNCQSALDSVTGEVGGYWAYGYYDDCWYENDIRRRRSRLLLDRNDDRPYYGPPIVTRESIRERRRYGDMAKMSVESLPFKQINGYACGGPAAQIEWLSRPEVMRALNIPSDAQFFQSDNGVGFTYELTEKDLISWYKDIISQNKLKIMVYNGDTDPCINAFQAQNWTRNLGIPEKESWRPWTLDSCQRMGGYVTRYENNFDFLTIRGSGHMVPQMKSRAALSFLQSFIQGTDYPLYDSSCSSPGEISAKKLETEEDVLREMERNKQEYMKRVAILENKLQMLDRRKSHSA